MGLERKKGVFEKNTPFTNLVEGRIFLEVPLTFIRQGCKAMVTSIYIAACFYINAAFEQAFSFCPAMTVANAGPRGLFFYFNTLDYGERGLTDV